MRTHSHSSTPKAYPRELTKPQTRTTPGTQIPYGASLFVVGVGWGLLPKTGVLRIVAEAAKKADLIDPAILLFSLMPILFFYAAFTTKWVFFRAELVQTLILSTFGVVINCVLLGAAMKYILEPTWSWPEVCICACVSVCGVCGRERVVCVWA